MKYIRHNRLGFFLFPKTDLLAHYDQAGFVQKTVGGSILSAGFVRWVEGKPECYGESISLNIRSDPGDTQALHRQLGLG